MCLLVSILSGQAFSRRLTLPSTPQICNWPSLLQQATSSPLGASTHQVRGSPV